MYISNILLFLYSAHVHHVFAVFIGGRTSCGANRSVTAATFVSSNCYRLTNANANLACSRYSNRPTVVNTGTSLFTAACNDPNPLVNGPRFGIYNAASLYYPDLQLVSSDSGAAILGLTPFLSYDPNTGYVQEGVSPPYDVTQVYSFTLINRLTGATSDPVYFTAKIQACSLVLAGPSSLTICTGPTAAAGQPATPTILGSPVALYTVCNPIITGVLFDGGFPGCPAVIGGDSAVPCYISATNNLGVTTIANYVLGPITAIPQIKFTQILQITATPNLPGGTNYFPGTKIITANFDPTCSAPLVTTSC